MKIAFKTNNTLVKYTKIHNEKLDHNKKSGVDINCGSCQKVYASQGGKAITIRYAEHRNAIKKNNKFKLCKRLRIKPYFWGNIRNFTCRKKKEYKLNQ